MKKNIPVQNVEVLFQFTAGNAVSVKKSQVTKCLVYRIESKYRKDDNKHDMKMSCFA